MGEAPRRPSVPEPNGEVAAVVNTSKHEQEKFERPKHRRTSSLPSTLPITTATDSGEGITRSDGKETQTSVTTVPTVTTLTGMDTTTTECSTSRSSSSDENETDREVSSTANSKAEANVVAPARSSPRRNISSTGGKGSKPSSMTIRHKASLGSSKVHGQQHKKRIPPPSPKKTPKPKGVRKAARFGVGELDSEDEAEKQRRIDTSLWSRKSFHRAKIAKEYSTSESEDEVTEDAEQQLRSSSLHHLDPKSNSITNKSMPKVAIDKEQSFGLRSHGVEKDDGNSSTDSEISTKTATYDSDDADEEDDDEHESKRRKIHSRKASLHKSPLQGMIKPSRVEIADEDESLAASSGRGYYRSDVESHDADHEHDLWEDEHDDETDDDRHIKKMKRRNEGNSASFSGAVSRNFRWSNVKTKIFYSFRAKGNDSDDEGSKVISVRNLAPLVNEHILQEFFGGCGTVTFFNISRDEFGRCSGSAYVEFHSGAAARKAVQKTGTKLLDRVVFCDVAHETSTSRHVESKATDRKSAEPQPARPPAGASGSTGGGIDIYSFLKAFHRGDNSEDSVRSRHKKSKSTESLHFSKGLISPGDTITASSGNEQSVHDPRATGESIRGEKIPGRNGGSKKKLFGLARSKSSGSSRNAGKFGGSQSHSQNGSQSRSQSREPELEQTSRSESREIEILPRGFEVQTQGFEVQTRDLVFNPRAVDLHSSSIPENAFEEGPNEGEQSSKGLNSKKRKWGFGKWRRRKHGWLKISLWKWVKKPRWHWWHFANLSARWGKARRHPSVKSTPAPHPAPPSEFQVEPPEGYPEGYPHFSTSSKQPSPERDVASA